MDNGPSRSREGELDLALMERDVTMKTGGVEDGLDKMRGLVYSCRFTSEVKGEREVGHIKCAVGLRDDRGGREISSRH